LTEDLLINSQKGDKSALLALIDKFNSLLKWYAFKLRYDDAYHDLLTDYIYVIKSINIGNMRNRNEGTYVSYLRESIYHCYTKRQSALHKQIRLVNYSSLKKEEQYMIDIKTATTDVYKMFDISDFKDILSEEEFTLIYLIYVEGLSASEIAHQKGITRQAVNQKKQKALKKLKKIRELF